MKFVTADNYAINRKVKLAKPCPSYTIGKTNPAMGTIWECEGILTGYLLVRWGNGSKNSYKQSELIYVDEQYKDIWEGL